MIEVGVREFKAHLSTYLHRVSTGVGLVVTSHGKKIARVEPPIDAPEPKDALTMLEELPWLRVGKGGKPQGAREHFALHAETPSLAQTISELRD
ncbi:MAG TPA: type II toxin-antitoxin system prevent-host-death family antitoxin [Thiomonas arsenitoxydans]|jgi:prevent-host-death family protein|uniref:type II toxin-antitoxin system Phd/YefM family antitoxin n=1 Tax=Thiomonas TaxID=32012 RepID=UPI00257CAD81|nr:MULTISPECIES: type II toxin-antitoxin system prevent-host-death family antitoxin [Thiomonas]HML80832.1 type II toxin-antitoxin system prevent-host-death family antitoxin [Thiomonas arsenitoxydans]